MKQYNKEDTYLRAKRQVENIKKFYGHLAAYIIVNCLLSGYKIYENLEDGETLQQAFFDFDTFAVWIFWGIGVAFHAFKVFGLPFILGKHWEEDKIKQFMDEDSQDRWE